MPWRINAVWAVECPIFVAPLYAMAKALYAKRVGKRFHCLVGKDFKPLHAIISKDELPPLVGGTLAAAVGTASEDQS